MVLHAPPAETAMANAMAIIVAARVQYTPCNDANPVDIAPMPHETAKSG